MASSNHKNQQTEQLWHTFSAAIMRALLSYEADPQLREDLAQEVFIALSQSYERILTATNVKAYVFRIVHNIAVDHIARCMRHKADLTMSDDIVDLHRNSESTNNQCPTEQLGQQQRQEILLHAVRTLKPPYRQVIVLMLEDFSSQEIAEILQISAGAVRVRINRAKVELKERLNHAN